MADRPIIFSAPMVRALLAGRKTQTRRLAKFVEADGDGWHIRNAGGGMLGADDDAVRTYGPDYAPYAVGDRLYVREHWRTSASLDHLSPTAIGAAALEAGYERPWAPMLYIADGTNHLRGYADEAVGKHRQGMHMPRWASRLTLRVEGVKVERLQDISRADAIAEGIEPMRIDGMSLWRNYGDPAALSGWDDPRRSFETLWWSIHGDGAWSANPWVVALTFRVEHGNIDRLERAHG